MKQCQLVCLNVGAYALLHQSGAANNFRNNWTSLVTCPRNEHDRTNQSYASPLCMAIRLLYCRSCLLDHIRKLNFSRSVITIRVISPDNLNQKSWLFVFVYFHKSVFLAPPWVVLSCLSFNYSNCGTGFRQALMADVLYKMKDKLLRSLFIHLQCAPKLMHNMIFVHNYFLSKEIFAVFSYSYS